jgi:hypothetical protein
MNVKGILDRLPAPVRHAVILFIGSLLVWAQAQARGMIVSGNPLTDAVISAAAASAVGTAILWFTNLTKQYGVGSELQTGE